MTRDEARAKAMDSGACFEQSKLTRRGSPRSFMICSSDAGHDGAHTACDGHGHVLARWKSETSLMEVWLPDGYHII